MFDRGDICITDGQPADGAREKKRIEISTEDTKMVTKIMQRTYDAKLPSTVTKSCQPRTSRFAVEVVVTVMAVLIGTGKAQGSRSNPLKSKKT